MRAFFFAVVGSLMLNVAALPHDLDTAAHSIHEKRDSLPGGWVRTIRANSRTILPVRVGLVEENLHRGADLLSEVSDPSSENYGKHWTPQQVIEMFRPKPETSQAAVDWLVAFGISEKRISHAAGRNWLAFESTVEEMENLLKTTYYVYRTPAGQEHVACDEYSVPNTVRDHIDLIMPTLHFNVPEKRDLGEKTKRGETPTPKVGPVINMAGHHPEDLSNCTNLITPACLRALYHIPQGHSNNSANSYGIVEFSPQSYNQGDLDLFFSTYTNIPNGTAPILKRIDSGLLYNETDIDTVGESNLDLEYAMALVWPQQITLFETGDGVGGGSRITNNNFLDAIDGSYCTYEGGDDPVWDEIFPDTWNDPHAYQGKQGCGTYEATHVISVSYGGNEAAHPMSYNVRQCNEYMKLGLQGVTVLFSSGDSGVSGIRGQCLTDNGGYTPPGSSFGRFNPMYPGVCPYITAVGATAIPANGTVHDRESVSTSFAPGGGFSNQFGIPDYQKDAIADYYAKYAPAYNSSRYNDTRLARGYPDVAVNGQDYAITVEGKFQPISGTSASSPTMGSIVALINEARFNAGKGPVGFINPVLYRHPHVLNDIITGNNPGCGTPGFTAVPGWDPASGLGSPNYPKMEKLFLSLP